MRPTLLVQQTLRYFLIGDAVSVSSMFNQPLPRNVVVAILLALEVRKGRNENLVVYLRVFFRHLGRQTEVPVGVELVIRAPGLTGTQGDEHEDGANHGVQGPLLNRRDVQRSVDQFASVHRLGSSKDAVQADDLAFVEGCQLRSPDICEFEIRAFLATASRKWCLPMLADA